MSIPKLFSSLLLTVQSFDLVDNIGNGFMFSSNISNYWKLVSDTAYNYNIFAARCSSKLLTQK